MESGQKKRRKKHKSRSSSSHRKPTILCFASGTRVKLDDVKTRGKKMAKTVIRTHRTTSSLLVGSQVSKSRSKKPPSSPRTSPMSHPDPVSHRGRGSVLSAVEKYPKKVNYKNPNVKELTKELVAKAQKKSTTKMKLSNADHPVRRGKPKTDSIFQQGRQRPTGPVRTFIVFKASSKHRQLRRRKPRHGLMSKLPSERRFSPVPVYKPRFYKKSELVGRKRTLFKANLSDKINVQGAGATGAGTNAAPATSLHSGAQTSITVKRRGFKKVPPRALTVGSKGATKLAPSSSTTGKAAIGIPSEKKAHVGNVHQAKAKPKKKGISVSILQKIPVRRRSRMYKLANAKPEKRHARSKASRGRTPAALALSRKRLLAAIRPGIETALKKRIANMQAIKRIEKDGM